MASETHFPLGASVRVTIPGQREAWGFVDEVEPNGRYSIRYRDHKKTVISNIPQNMLYRM